MTSLRALAPVVCAVLIVGCAAGRNAGRETAATTTTVAEAPTDARPQPLLDETFDHPESAAPPNQWNMPVGATIVVSDRDGAGNCLHVPRPRERGFAELNVSVVPGRVYRGSTMLKCRDVTGSKGAVLYLQFSDAERKHVNGGSFPIGLKGTHGWRELVVDHTIPIPDNVAFVRVTVGIDGTGEAWFDDVRLEEITHWDGLSPASPAAGLTVASALPELRWSLDGSTVKLVKGRGSYAVELELSQDPAFAAGTVTRAPADVEDGACRPPHALAPGVWYWRVNLLCRGVRFPPSPSAWFRVPVDAVAWPPLLTQDWSWSDAPCPELAVVVSPPEAAIHAMEALIDGVPADILGTAAGRIRFRPGRALAAGVYEVRVTVKPPPGHAALAPVVLTGIFCGKQPAARVTFRSDGIMLVDGFPRFPIGAYRDPSDREDVFDGLIEAGFDVTHSYRMDNAAIKEPETRRAYLEAAHANGIGVFLGMPRDMVRERKTTELARYVAETMDTPGLLAWYQFDEPEIQNCTPEDLMATYRAISAVDPFHPKITLVCSISRPVSDPFRRYAAGCDVFWEDPYPVPSKPLLMVEEKILACREAAGPGKPVWCVLQGFSWEAWKAWGNLSLKGKGKRSDETVAAMRATGTVPATRPSALETRGMAHLAIAAGAKGLIWYWSPNCAVHVKEDSPEIWAGIKATVSELRGLMPWLLAEPTPADEISVPAPLRGWSRIAEGTRLTVLINPDDTPAAVPVDQLPEALRTAPPDPDAGLDTAGGQWQFPPHHVAIIRTPAPAGARP